MNFIYTDEFIQNALSYEEYCKSLELEISKPPVDENEEKMRPYIQHNIGLMKNFNTTYQVSKNLKATLDSAPKTIWVVLTEGWCGDAAFNVPMFSAIERSFPSKVRLCLFLRDKNPELMDAHLTNGGRSIPKLIILRVHDLVELKTWGPRPDALQTQMKKWKEENLSLKEIIPRVQQWYDIDNTNSLQKELISIVKSYTSKH